MSAVCLGRECYVTASRYMYMYVEYNAYYMYIFPFSIQQCEFRHVNLAEENLEG